jgi:hypothetical protein
MKVDNTTTVPYNEKRNSIRLTSKTTFGVGSVWVLDALHTPYGCSSVGLPCFPTPSLVADSRRSYAGCGQRFGRPGQAPGRRRERSTRLRCATNAPVLLSELLTVEPPFVAPTQGVNLEATNHMAWHTSAHGSSSCELTSTASMSGTLNGTDCLYTANDNSGCAVLDSDPASYGADFAAAGGGVYITEFAETGINIWFFQRANIPTAILSANETIDLSSLGTPAATLSDSSCDIDTFFGGPSSCTLAVEGFC